MYTKKFVVLVIIIILIGTSNYNKCFAQKRVNQINDIVDIDKDNRIGIGDLIYALKVIAGMSDDHQKKPNFFDSNDVLSFTITSEFDPAFKDAHAGEPDGIFPPQRLKYYFPGEFQLDGYNSVFVDIKVRGNSSLQECSFPKLKIKATKEERSGTIFEDVRKIKIGTHCSDEDTPGHIGRLRSEIATHREAFVYQILKTLGIESMRARAATITYNDSSLSSTIVRDSFIFEHIDVLADRLNGKAIDDPSDIETVYPQNAIMNPQIVSNIQFFQALIGNWDFNLPIVLSEEKGSKVWNMEMIVLSNNILLPIPTDFDLASIVTGKIDTRSPPADLMPEQNDITRQAAYYINKINKTFSNELISVSKEIFESKKIELEKVLADAPLDDSGRSIASEHISGFYLALSLMFKEGP
ncbi:hypothetical protein MHK_004655 [Candidatus Magnetomorum sp. HK-1]|nr:hypothetical protein MHK_004655 [Candidatus Magnetomorum sp. HK-1]